MEAIKHIVALTEAETIEEMDTEMLAAHEAVNALHLQKLQEMELEVHRRLGVKANVGMSPNVGIPRDRRPVRDDPQA